MKYEMELLLKRWPFIYQGARILYQKACYVRGLISGTKVQERYWKRRHLREGMEWIEAYWENTDHPHRSFLVEKMEAFYPFSSILEVGCNSGPNLRLLAKKFPGAKIRGIDINPVAVEKGNEWFAREGLSNVQLFVGRADQLDQFPDKEFDIVFSDAALIYIGPDKIKKVITEMIRIARKTIILLEWHHDIEGEDLYGLGSYYLGQYKRNYRSLLRQFSPFVKEFRIMKLPKELWPDKNWQELGHIVEAHL